MKFPRQGHSIYCLLGIIASASLSYGGVYCRAGTTIGQSVQYLVKENESLLEIARFFDVGQNEIITANREIDPFIPPAGSVVTIPSCWILPDLSQYNGIVINIPEMRLYYFPNNARKAAVSFPVGIGGKGRETLPGSYSIIEKATNPSWHVPESIRLENSDLPKTVPPGPDNPLGRYALRLSRHNILIHGTNRPFSVGRQATHGCIRLYPEDIRKLFTMVSRGTTVTIISQPVKVAAVAGSVYMEVHGEEGRDLLKIAKMKLQAMRLMDAIDAELLMRAILEKKGIPVNISRKAASQGLLPGKSLVPGGLL